MADKKRQLIDLIVTRISIVDRPCTDIPFGLIKRHEQSKSEAFRKSLALEGVASTLARFGGWVDKVDVTIDFDLKKVGTADAQLIGGVAYPANQADLAGDWVSPETLEKAAHQFLISGAAIDVQHSGRRIKASIVESTIAKADFECDDGSVVHKGDWWVVAHVADSKVWSAIRSGVLKGWSIEGRARTLSS